MVGVAVNVSVGLKVGVGGCGLAVGEGGGGGGVGDGGVSVGVSDGVSDGGGDIAIEGVRDGGSVG